MGTANARRLDGLSPRVWLGEIAAPRLLDLERSQDEPSAHLASTGHQPSLPLAILLRALELPTLAYSVPS